MKPIVTLFVFLGVAVALGFLPSATLNTGTHRHHHQVIAFTASADKNIDVDCESGAMCHKCGCKGMKDTLRGEGEPDNPANKKYPRGKCNNYCSKDCCVCRVEK
jgi:hypothetical protein